MDPLDTLFDVASSTTSRYVWQHSSHGFMSHYLSHISTSSLTFPPATLTLIIFYTSLRKTIQSERETFCHQFLSSFGKRCWMYNAPICSLTLQFSFRWKSHSTFNPKLSSVHFLQFLFFCLLYAKRITVTCVHLGASIQQAFTNVEVAILCCFVQSRFVSLSTSRKKTILHSQSQFCWHTSGFLTFILTVG